LNILCLMMLLALSIITVGKLFGGPSSFSFRVEDIFGALDPESYRSLSTTGLGHAVIKAIGTPLFLSIYLATSIKRLHDRNKSAWWMMLFFLFPASSTNSRIGSAIPIPSSLSGSCRLSSSCGVSSNWVSSGERKGPTGSAPTRWRRSIRGRLGTSKAKSKWCRTRPAHRRRHAPNHDPRSASINRPCKSA